MSKEKKESALFVKKSVRDFVNDNGYNISGKVIKGVVLNNAIKKLLKSAMEKATKSKRKTLMPQDFKGLVN